jgi:hypothetical protein
VAVAGVVVGTMVCLGVSTGRISVSVFGLFFF